MKRNPLNKGFYIFPKECIIKKEPTLSNKKKRNITTTNHFVSSLKILYNIFLNIFTLLCNCKQSI
jgi:hypothetical protein